MTYKCGYSFKEKEYSEKKLVTLYNEKNLLLHLNGKEGVAKRAPPLSPGTSSHPSSSQELAEIFGTSDDEDDEFSFDLNPSLPINKSVCVK